MNLKQSGEPKSAGFWQRFSPEQPLILFDLFTSHPNTHGWLQSNITSSQQNKFFGGVVYDCFQPELPDHLGALLKQLEVHNQLTTQNFDPLYAGIVVSTPSQVLAAVQAKEQTKKLAQNTFLFVPGEFCRQADLLAACNNSNIPLILEKGAFLPPTDMEHAVKKLPAADVLLMDAGAAFGQADRVLDPRSLFLLRKTANALGINLVELCKRPEGEYAHKPLWLQDERFLQPIYQCAKTFGAVCYLVNTIDDWRKVQA